MKRIIFTISFLSILWGALFFLSQSIAANPLKAVLDSTILSDTNLFDSINNSTHAEQDSLAPESKKNHLITARNSDSSLREIDTLSNRINREKRIPSPQRATILSATLPGLGQAYNGKYWKIPIIYVGGAGLCIHLYESNRQYNDWTSKYDRKKNGDPDVDDTLEFLQGKKDEYFSRRTYAILYIGALYLANIIDAMTDAYFLQYDMSDDLSVKLSPSVERGFYMAANNYSYGFNVSVQF